MAGTSLLALLDDIATVLDDIAVMTKVAAKKTAGVLGDDLAVNAEQVSGVRAERELPVVWAVAKGSFRNKLILVPAALLISALAPWAITPLLMLGGCYLCYEGFEKVVHHGLPGQIKDDADHVERVRALANPRIDLVAFEREKIKGAIRTDFVLSAEIIIIALGTVQAAAMGVQVAVVAGIALLMTIGVYALVAAIVRLDDLGLHLLKQTANDDRIAHLRRVFGRGLVRLAPILMKTLSVVGTAAMFLVGGGILLHGFPFETGLVHSLVETVHRFALIGGFLAAIIPLVVNTLAGFIAGGLICSAAAMARKIFSEEVDKS